MQKRDETREGHETGSRAEGSRVASRHAGKALWLAVGLLFLGSLSYLAATRALFDPDEGRNGVIAVEMATSGDVLVPTLNGLPFLDKPFLYFSAEALAIRLLGPTEFAVRSPSLLFFLATVLLTAAFARRWFGRPDGWVALLLGATTLLALVMGQIAIFDSMLSFFMVVALLAFFEAIEASRDDTSGDDSSRDGAASETGTGTGRYRAWTALAWGAMALGVLTKGPVALAVPLLVAVPFAVWRRASRAVWHPVGWGLHLLILVPWLIATEVRVPGFLHYALVTETWARLTTDEMHRTGPIWYFLPLLLIGAFPWSFVALAGLRRRTAAALASVDRARLIYLTLWVLLPLVFFSLSQSKRPHYILPLMPAVVLLAVSALRGAGAKWGMRAGAVGWISIGSILIALAAGWVPIRARMEPELLAAATRSLAWFGLVALVGGLAAWFLASRRELQLLALALPLLLLPSLLQPAVTVTGQLRSARQMARELEPRMTDASRLVGIETYAPSLSFYLDRPIHLLSTSAEALTSNYVLRNYARLVDDSRESTLQPREALGALLQGCVSPDIFLFKSKYEQVKAQLEAARLPVVSATEKLVAMGPCRLAAQVPTSIELAQNRDLSAQEQP